MIQRGELRAMRIGKLVRIPIDQVVAMESRCANPISPDLSASPGERNGTSDAAAVASLRAAKIERARRRF
jgi:hypothetical protein